MANYYSFLVTERTFRVKDMEAFKLEIGPYAFGGNHEASGWASDGLTYSVEPDGTIWLGGYDTDLTRWDPETDVEIDVAAIVQRHLADGEVAVLHHVGHEKLRYVTGRVIVITPEGLMEQDLGDLEQMLVANATGEGKL